MDNSTHDMSEQLVQYLDGELAGAEKKAWNNSWLLIKICRAELESLKSTPGSD